MKRLPEPEIKGLYKHFKGTVYVVLGVATHTEVDYKLVIYHPEGEPEKLYARPEAMFHEEVIVKGERKPRFQKCKTK